MSDGNFDEDLYEQELLEDLQSGTGLSARYLELKAQHEASLAAFVTGASSSKKKAKRRYINRERAAGGDRVYKDYFDVNPTYPPDKFRRRYRMHRPLFDRIFNAVLEKDPYFQQKWQVTGEKGLTPYQKISAAFRILAYGVCADYLDEYLRIGESTAIECMKRFCRAVVQCFAAEYLRVPTSQDMMRLLIQIEERGFPGMLGSLDCMHWDWKNCPKFWQAAYTNYKKHPSIVLEAIASYDGWFWHCFFGMPGSYNDINTMNASTVWDSMMSGHIAAQPYQINDNWYNTYYYLGDGIYPKYSTIVKTVATPRTAKEKNFAAYQEGCRKDVERAFGQFQARWHIIRQPANYWDKDDLHSIMLCCVIMHNMICEDERGLEKCDYYIVKSDRKKKQDRDNARRREFEAGEPGGSSDEDELDELDEVGVQKKEDFKEDKWRYAEKKAFYAQMQSHELHERMKVDLIEHCWKHRGASRTERGVATTTI